VALEPKWRLTDDAQLLESGVTSSAAHSASHRADHPRARVVKVAFERGVPAARGGGDTSAGCAPP
jgi:hypothetical protein